MGTKVSIIVPVYEAAAFLEETIASVGEIRWMRF